MRAEIVDYAVVREEIRLSLETGNLARVKARLEPLAEQPDATRSASENLLLYSTLGRVYDEVEMADEALHAFQVAYSHDTRDLHALEALAREIMVAPESDATLPVLNRLLVFHRYELRPSAVARIYDAIARHHQSGGDLDAARTAYEKALEATPGDMAVINALLSVAQEAGDSEAVQAVRERLLTSLTNAESRAAVLVAIGDDYLAKLNDPVRAIDAWERALAECATSVPALTRIADLAVGNEEWTRAVRALQTLGEVEEGVEERVVALDRAATIYREQLDSSAMAIAVYNKILDLQPSAFEAFKIIAQLLEAEGDHGALEQNYVRMLERQKASHAGPEVLEVLYRALGQLRAEQLGDVRGAAEALQAASDLVPDELSYHVVLSELYSQLDDLLDNAVHEHREILRLAPDRLESVDALATLYRRLERFDESLCVFRVLEALGRSGDEGRRIVERYSTHRAAKLEGVLDSEVWEQALYPDFLERSVGGILALAQPALLELFAHDLEHYGLREKDARFDLNDDTFFGRIYKSVIKTVGTPEMPPVYVDKSRTGMRNAYLYPSAMLIGSDLLSGRQEREIAFIAAKAMTLYRPEFFLTQFGGHGVLEGVMYTIFKTFRPDLNIEMSKNMQRISKDLEKKLKLDAQKQIKVLIDHILDSGVAVNLKLFIEGAEDTANRAALLLCDDLPTARTLLEQETEPLGKRDANERFGSLLMWTLSDSYMALRKRLGLSIGQ